MFSVRPLRATETPLRVYVILLALCVCYTLCGAVCADNIAWPKQAEIFAHGETQLLVNGSGVKHNITTDLRYVPYFISADGVMIAFAGGEYIRNDNRNSNIIARYVETEGENWTHRVTDNNGAHWKTQLAMHKIVENESSNFFMNSFIAATNKNKIYLFAVNLNLSAYSVRGLFVQNFELHLSVGKIKTNVTAQSAEKIIEWQSLDQQAEELTQTLKRELRHVILYAGIVSFIIDKKTIFVFEADVNGKSGFLFVSSNDMENMTEWNVSCVYPPDGCYDPRFVMWKSELLMLPNRCIDGKQAVMKSLDMGKTWTTAEPSFVRLFNYMDDKDDLTVATINNKTALMYTQEVVGETVSGKWFKIHLWVFDGNRVRNIGPLVFDDNYIFSFGIVYANGELFFMYEQRENNQHKKVIVSHLKKEIKKIMFVLNTWDKMDKYLSKPCNETARQNASLDTLCVTPVPIDGLVGFFSNGVDNNTYWRDEYLYVSAIVKGGTKVDNGFTFTGAGAGAKWHLVRKGRILYHLFVYYGLTVVATVRIHGALGNNTPLLTVGGIERDAERQGLWYGSEGQWRVMSRGNDVAVGAAGGWETNRTYSVALVVRNNTIAAYVGGNFVGGDVLRTPVPEGRPFAFLNLFIAGYKGYNRWRSYSSVTVTNVLLYNRQLNETEMRAMSNTLES